MTTAKEKKLNAIKREISEITDFIRSNNNVNNFDTDKDDEIESYPDDTLTLTNIVNYEPKFQTKDDLTEIKNELYILKQTLNKNEIMLKEILLKIK
tara:strand:- start:123 stop:410 length:288 start_codon:yes stop_codon:yes gene_type:complete